jgi:hypothetical protein
VLPLTVPFAPLVVVLVVVIRVEVGARLAQSYCKEIAGALIIGNQCFKT